MIKQAYDYRASSTDLDQPLAVYSGQVITRGCFWADVLDMAQTLPERNFVINLCQNRYLFTVTLLAAAVRNHTCLLPPSNQSGPISELCRDYPGAYIVSEAPYQLAADWIQPQKSQSPRYAAAPKLDWPKARLIAFTSGSRGKPQPHSHSFQTFRVSAQMATTRLGLENRAWLMVSTTPAQHMYGLETSIFWPLFSRLILHDGRPFFPEDLRQVLDASSWPTILVTTPAHLRHFMDLKLAGTNLRKIISATDTLSSKLAQQCQDHWGLSPLEIYGSTESLSFASRETLQTDRWQLYENCQITADLAGEPQLTALHLPKPLLLQDQFQLHQDRSFKVLGRHHDMLKIAGKRISLNELNRLLRDIDGVEDGFFFVLPGTRTEQRLGIAVVSQLDKTAIKQALTPYIDEVFLPRKIHFVDEIPRNQAGKLLQAEQDKLLGTLI